MRFCIPLLLVAILLVPGRHGSPSAEPPEIHTLSPNSTLFPHDTGKLERTLWDALARSDRSRLRSLALLLSGESKIYRLSLSPGPNVPIPGITELPRDDIGPWLACGLDCPFEIRPLHPEIETAFTWILMPLLENLLQHGTRKPALLLIRYGTDEKRGDFVEFVTLDTGKGFAFDVLRSLGRTMRFPRFEKMRLSHFGTGQGLAQAMNYADEMEILTGRYRWTLDSNDRCTLDSSSNGIPGSLVRARLWTRSPKRRRTELKNRINAWFFRMKTPSPFPGRKIRIAC